MHPTRSNTSTASVVMSVVLASMIVVLVVSVLETTDAGAGVVRPTRTSSSSPSMSTHVPSSVDEEDSSASAPFLRLPRFIASHMVLQRAPSRAALWGWASPGGLVTVELLETGEGGSGEGSRGGDDGGGDDVDVVARVEAVADATTGEFRLWLPPQPAGHGLAIRFSLDPTPTRRMDLTPPKRWSSSAAVQPTTTVTIHDVAFGEVWLCSGQSNMQFTVAGSFNGSAEIAAAGDYPLIRLATVALTSSSSPQADVRPATDGSGASGGSAYRDGAWAPSSPEAFDPARAGDPRKPYGGDGAFGWFSATCYFFGRELHRRLGGGVPVGLVDADWGGQRVECFSSPEALADDTCGGTLKKKVDVEEEVKSPEKGMRSGRLFEATTRDVSSLESRGTQGVNPTASSLWNGMIYPLLRMRFAGVAWYQGEANFEDPPGYACRFPAMIADWRAKMNAPNLTFVFVQLAAYPKHDYAETRNAQMTALRLPAVGYAVAVDLGDPASPWDCVHPRRKQEVGRRLALAAIQQRYAADEVSASPVHFRGPVFASERPQMVDTTGGDEAGGEGGDEVGKNESRSKSRLRLRMRLRPSREGGAPPGTVHAHPTADCALTGSTRCCDEPPFEVRLSTRPPRPPPSASSSAEESSWFFQPPSVGSMASAGHLGVLTDATQAKARQVCLATPACAGFSFQWNTVRNLPPPEGAVFSSVYLHRTAPDGVSMEWDVNASWTSVARSGWSTTGGWVRADTFLVENTGDEAPEDAAAVVVEVTVPGGLAKGEVVSVSAVRYAWERYPQCSLYDGSGSWDHREDGIAATPFCYDVDADAPCPPTKISNP